MVYVPSGLVSVLTAGPVGGIATTDAKATGCPFAVTRPEIDPNADVQFEGPYKTESDARSSASIGRSRDVSRITSCDMAAEVQVCCKPSACPISCTAVVKKLCR